MQRLMAAAFGVIVVGSSAGMPPPAAADDAYCTAVGKYCAFYSPSHHIDCEMLTGSYAPRESVYCKTVEPPQSVSMDNTGLFQSCTGMNCLGNEAQGIPTLAYGQTMALGPFKCLSEVTGITCTAQGHGFNISASGITIASE